LAARTGFYLHPASPLHDTGWGHPEHQGRLRSLASTVGRDMLTLHGLVEQRDAREADEQTLALVHDEAHVRRVAEVCRLAEESGTIVALDSDTRVSAASWEAALGSVGTSIEAARAIVVGELTTAFVATRPPGHHATPTTPMGFCLFNNVALTARWLQHEGHAERVLIVDWDVHHGNGTQDAFYDDPTVFFLSLHQWPHYPGTGAADERGSGAGRGATLNVPLPAGTPRSEYLERFEAALADALAWGRPDFVLVSSGFDAMAGDPLGGLLLEPEDFWTLTRGVVDLADDACGGRVLALLEGGYDPPRLGLGAVAVLRGLAGLEAP
jgi:acetoin utilization deacetylase AcuC-like enzyme